MIVKKWKIIFLLCGCSVLLYVHLKDYEHVATYREHVHEGLNRILSNVPRVWLQERDYEPRTTGVPLPETSMLQDATTLPSSSETTTLPHITEESSVVVFPTTMNCSKDQNLRTKTKKFVPSLYAYPCRKWHAASPRDRRWPAVLPPSRGSVLEETYVKFSDSKMLNLVDIQMEVQRSRVERLTNTCLAHPELAVRQHLTLVWDSQRKPPLVYCPIYKAASTTWFVYFLRLAHVNDNNPILNLYNETEREKKKYMPRFGGGHRRVFEEYKAPNTSWEKAKVFRKALRFIVVRHPLTRLLSAYRDKIERRDPRPYMAYFKDLQKAIIAKYRPANSTDTSAVPSFPEFVDYVIESTENLTTAEDWTVNVVTWTPYWVQCGVCSSDYQVVIKLETMTDDEQFLAHVANLKEIQKVQEWRNLKQSAVSSSQLLPDYYKRLTKDQVHLLYERYKLDFELFDYTVDEYLKYAL